MSDVRVHRSGQVPPTGVPSATGEHRRQRDDRHEERQERERGGREELAVALGEPGRALVAHLETDADGEAVVRIVDRVGGETIAVLTPDELRVLAEQTGLPPGLLFQARS